MASREENSKAVVATEANLWGELAWELTQRVAARLCWSERLSIAFQALGLMCGASLVIVSSVCDPLPVRVVMALGLAQLLISGIQSLLDRVLSVRETVQLASAGQKLEASLETSEPTPSNPVEPKPFARIPSLPSSRNLPGFFGFPILPSSREKALLDQLRFGIRMETSV